MKKEAFEKTKKELIWMLVLSALSIAIFKIAFFSEELIIVIKTVLSVFWLFVLPGYFIMLYWHENLSFLERLVVGIALSGAIIGIASYYIGIIGLNIKFHTVLLPAILILFGLALNAKNLHA